MALQAAHEILIEHGPHAVTLKAVAAKIGRTHANLLHHFGSAAGLHKAATVYIAEQSCATIGDAVRRAQLQEGSPREIVDLTFASYREGGGSALITWALQTGNEDAIKPIFHTVKKLLDELSDNSDVGHEILETTHWMILMALGDALYGEQLSSSFGLPHDSARSFAEGQLAAARDRWWNGNSQRD